MEGMILSEDTTRRGGLKPFEVSLKETNLYPLRATGVVVLQVNVGRVCNQSCRHCHVEAGPQRKEIMSREVMEMCLDVVRRLNLPMVDITGGAPEMNPHYRWFVEELNSTGAQIKTRTNLTILTEAGYEDMPEFFARNRIEVIGSLPYYLESTTDRQRGEGIFKKSIDALRRLNSIGYGIDGTGLVLNLVYNPCGAYLPPSQGSIEADFKRELKRRYGVSFNNLFTLTNMPVGRFLNFLRGSNNLIPYLRRLQESFNPVAAENVMCREMVSVAWDGSLYDCDFNQMLGLKCNHGAPNHLRDFDYERIVNRKIVTGIHCYGCTAGSGSSCTGAVA